MKYLLTLLLLALSFATNAQVQFTPGYYPAGSLTKNGDKIFKAKKAVNAKVAPTVDNTYWEWMNKPVKVTLESLEQRVKKQEQVSQDLTILLPGKGFKLLVMKDSSTAYFLNIRLGKGLKGSVVDSTLLIELQ